MWGDSGIDWTHSRPTPDKRTHLIKSKRKRSFFLIKRLFFPYEESYNSFQCFFLHLFFSPEHTEDTAILCYNNKIRITLYCLLFFFFFSCVCVRARVFLCFTLFFFCAFLLLPLFYQIRYFYHMCLFFFCCVFCVRRKQLNAINACSTVCICFAFSSFSSTFYSTYIHTYIYV